MTLTNLVYFGDCPSHLALGCEPLGGTDWGDVDLTQAQRAVQCAWDMGITTFDTADVYGLGKGESQLSVALGTHRHEAFIITKFGIAWEPNVNGKRARTYKDMSPQHMRRSLEASLRRLRIEAIPLYLIHWPDPTTDPHDTLDALENLRQQGKILNYGLSNFSPKELAPLVSHRSVAAVEASYNLLNWQKQRPLFDLASTHGLARFAYGVLAQGLLTGKYKQHHRFDSSDRRSRLDHFGKNQWDKNDQLLNQLQVIASNYNKSVAQCVLRWVLDDGCVDSVIVGAKTPEQVKENLAVLDWCLQPEDVERLRSLL